jgi:tight adherence protein C
MSQVALVPFLIALAFGLGVALFTAWLARGAAEVPSEDRTYRDPPPRAMRLVWWPIQWIAFYIGPRLSLGYRQRLLGKLRLAGLDFSLSPAQFVACRIIAALLALVIAAFVLRTFNVGWLYTAAAALFGWAFPAIWLRDQLMVRRLRTLKTLPFMLDLMTLCVEAGLNLTGALQQAVAKGPAGPLRDEMARVLRDMRAGKPRAQALRQLADRMDESSIHSMVSALIQAENTGMDLGPVLRAQAEQRRTERFVRAEKLAMEAPVKMLMPLIGFIFPCTFLIIAFPIAMKFLGSGIFN